GALTVSLGPLHPELAALYTASACLWGLAAIIGVIFLLIFLTVPSERPIALGMLTVIALAVFLFAFHLLGVPFPPFS
ncbi:MAG TPA: hypothetical protein VN729_13560, partial [Ktedonobacteraceae bacterium]|nr:hypothetical protein [Ktedonobacteraceae bacterium]